MNKEATTTGRHRLAFLEPGHFHAALLLRTASSRVDTDVHVYATAGPELDAFVNLVNAFNTRSEQPCSWHLVHHPGDLEQLVTDGHATVAVLAGDNGSKLSRIEALASRGLHVLADKPWLTHPNQLSCLHNALGSNVMVMDMMTIRHEILSRLCHAVVTTPFVFGSFVESTVEQPAVEVGSVHHLYKQVNGRPLRRPVWYYDVTRQGDGLVDIQSHMIEQGLWFTVMDNQVANAAIEFHNAHRWSTDVTRNLFEKSTGHTDFPDSLAHHIDGDVKATDAVLHYPCNGTINWSVNGIHIKQEAEWRTVEPDGGGDLHHVRLRGTKATVSVDQGAQTNYQARVSLSARSDSDFSTLKHTVMQTLPDWQIRFPGLDVITQDNELIFVAPASLDDGHESHFPLVREQFLDIVEQGAMPPALIARINARYKLIKTAKEFVDG